MKFDGLEVQSCIDSMASRSGHVLRTDRAGYAYMATFACDLLARLANGEMTRQELRRMMRDAESGNQA